MQTEDINYLIRQGEGLKIEFKEAKDSVPHSFYDTVVSFANTDGGTILLGVDDNGKVTGIDPEAKVKLQKDIITAMNSTDVINPPMYVQPIVVNHPDGEIMVMQIPCGSQIHKYKNRIYSREFESDLDVTDIIVHREYTSAYSTELIISATEVRITNPNRPLFHGVIQSDGFNPFPKNPNIRKFFTAFGWTDEIGSGIRNSNKYLPLYADGAKPIFYENDTFVTEIPLKHFTLGKFSNEFIAWLQLGKEAEAHLRTGLINITLPATLSDCNWEDLLLHLVPSWHQNGTQSAPLNWPENQVFEISEIKTVPSWTENGTQLLRKKAWYLIAILSLCTVPVKFIQLMNYIGYKNEKSFREKYIKPLRDVGYIQMTNPENTTDPENKYIITEEGKAFLAGQINNL